MNRPENTNFCISPSIILSSIVSKLNLRSDIKHLQAKNQTIVEAEFASCIPINGNYSCSGIHNCYSLFMPSRT